MNLRFLLVILCIGLLIWPAARADIVAPEPGVVELSLNGKTTVQMEVIQWPDNTVSYPVKALAGLLDIESHQTNQDHAVTFTHPLTKEAVRVDVQNQRIAEGTRLLDRFRHPLVYVENGFLSKQEVYLHQDWLQEFYGVTLAFDAATQSASLTVNRPVKILIRYEQEAIQQKGKNPSGKDASAIDPETLVLPEEKSGRILDTVTLDVHSNVSPFTPLPVGSGGVQPAFMNLNSDLRSTLQGSLLGIPYELTPRFGFRNGQFGLTGLQGQLHWKNATHDVTAGVIAPSLGPVVAPNLSLLGVRLASRNVAASRPGERQWEFSGRAEGNGEVRLRINDSPVQAQWPRQGRYRFKNVNLTPDRMNVVEIVQNQADGAPKTLRHEEVSVYRNLLRAGERAYSVFAGRTPFLFRPVGYVGDAQQKGMFLSQSNKWVVGGGYQVGLTDRWTAGVSLTADHIVGAPRSNQLNAYLNRIFSPDLTGNIGVQRDANLESGVNLGLGSAYRFNDRWSLTADGGVSINRPALAAAVPVEGGLGLGGLLRLSYEKDPLKLALSLYHYSPNYYTAVTQGFDRRLYDRQGVMLSGSSRILKTTVGFELERFRTNLGRILPGGPVSLERWNVSANRQLTRKTYLNFFSFGTTGRSEAGLYAQGYTQLGLAQRLPWKMSLRMALLRTNSQLLLNPLNASPFVSSTEKVQARNLLTTSLTIPVRRNGSFLGLESSLSRDLSLVGLRPDIRLGPWSIRPLAQKSVWGAQDLLNLGLGIYYQRENGQHAGFNYLISSSAYSAQGRIPALPRQISHQLQIDFGDAFALLGDCLASVGSRRDSSGILTGQVFLDKNQNGQWEAEEPGLPKVPLLLDGRRPLRSGRNGRFHLTGLGDKLYTLSYDFNRLSLFLTPTTPPPAIVINPGRRTAVAMGLTATPGSISGLVELKDAKGNAHDPVDVVVVLKDAATGREVKFTYADADGQYIISEIIPGDYEVSLDPIQAKQRGIRQLSVSHPVTVPLKFDNAFEKTNLNFKALQLL